MDIQAKRASLDTLSVTIRALHVDGKQMTLAVFRQLPIARAYQDDGSLTVLEHWGLVNYKIKDQGDVWVVASTGGCLYRCNIRHNHRSVEDAAMSLQNAQEDRDDILACDKNTYKYRKHWLTEKAMRALMARCPLPDVSWHQDAKTHDARKKWIDERLPDMVLEQHDKEIQWRVADLNLSRRYESSFSALGNLPQLFIAV